jgi:hypothetical protein
MGDSTGSECKSSRGKFTIPILFPKKQDGTVLEG